MRIPLNWKMNSTTEGRGDYSRERRQLVSIPLVRVVYANCFEIPPLSLSQPDRLLLDRAIEGNIFDNFNKWPTKLSFRASIN